MDSDETKPSGSKSNPIEEYYRKHSQNRELPKYFCGTSVKYVPEIVTERGLCDKPTVVITKIEQAVEDKPSVVITEIDDEKHTESDGGGDQSKNISPTSSITSTKKLEWDNGADIGYDNCNKNIRQRSSSLPLLHTLERSNDRRDEALNFKNAKKFQPANKEDKEDGNVQVIPVYTSSSSDCNIDNANAKILHTSSSSCQNDKLIPSSSTTSSYMDVKNTLASSTTSSSGTKIPTVKVLPHIKDLSSSSDSSLERQKIAQFSSTLAYLKRKIGMPEAESTPKEEGQSKTDKKIAYTETPMIKKTQKPAKLLSAEFLKSKNADSVIQNDNSGSKYINDSRKNLTKATLSKISSSCENLCLSGEKQMRKIQSEENVVASQNMKPDQQIKKIKVINLCKTKPVSVECIGICKIGGNKKIQTSLTAKKTSKYTQTDKIDEKTLIKLVDDNNTYEEKQNIIFVDYSGSPENVNIQSSVVQTDLTSITSNCESFEYLSGCEYLQNKVIENKENIALDNQKFTLNMESSEVQSSKLKRSEAKQDLRKVSDEESNESSSKNLPLGALISANQSDKLLVDIRESVTLLQKLVNSNKYDRTTKKRYVKRIIQKLVDSKYVEDSSTSSDLFRPKKPTSNPLGAAKQTDITTEKSTSSESADKNSHKSSLNQNIPWYPVQIAPPKNKTPFKNRSPQKYKLSPPKQKPKPLQIRTESEEIIPEINDKYQILLKQTEKDSSETSNAKVKRNQTPEHYVLRNQQPEVVNNVVITSKNQRSYGSNTSDKIDAVPFFIPSPPIEQQPIENNNESSNGNQDVTTSSSQSSRNWRQEKTLSERLLEERTSLAMGQGDHLVQYAKKERKNQLSWINNEIDHLSKLKNLLEKKPADKFSGHHHMYTETRVGDMKGIKKTTTVYMVAEDYGAKSSASSSRYNTAQNTRPSSGRSERNFVIETELTDSVNSDEINFHLVDDQGPRTYSCKEMAAPNKSHRKKLVGDIKVSTVDNTTNITVKARRPNSVPSSAPSICTCQQSPCVCGPNFIPKQPVLMGQGVYQHSSFPRSVTESRFGSECLIQRPNVKSSSCTCFKETSPCVRCSLELPTNQGVSLVKKIEDALRKAKQVTGGKCNCLDKNNTRKQVTSSSSAEVCSSSEEDKLRKPCPKLQKSETFKVCIDPVPEKVVRTSKNTFTRPESPKNVRFNPEVCVCDSQSSTDKFTNKNIEKLWKCDSAVQCDCGNQNCKCTNKSTATRSASLISTNNSTSTNKDVEKLCKCDSAVQCDCGNQNCRCTNKSTSTKSASLINREACLCDSQTSTHICTSTNKGIDKVCKCNSAVQCNCGNQNCKCTNKSTSPINPELCLCDSQTSTHKCMSTNKSIQKLCKCNSAIQCDCGLQNCECAEVQAQQEKKDAKCMCGNTSCLCDMSAQTKQNAVKSQKIQSNCVCDSKEQQTTHCVCENQEQTAIVCPICNCAVQTQPERQDANCGCGILNCQCDMPIQTEIKEYKSQKMQFSCVCSSEQLQTEGCVCKNEDQQTVFVCTDKNLQSERNYCHVDTQTTPNLKHSKFAQSGGKLQSTKTQIKCDCDNRGVQCECECNDETCQNSAEEVDDCECGPEPELEQINEESCTCTETTTEFSETESPSSESFVECVCCKQKKAPSRKFEELRNKLNNDAKPLCHPCFRVNQRTPWTSFNNPQHICRCYTLVQTSTFQEIKRTVDELTCMEQLENSCTCPAIKSKHSSKCCRYCKSKLKNVEKNKNGVAYMLTFEYEKPKKHKQKQRSPQKLEEIRVKVPYPHHKKKHKNRENEKRKEKYRSSDETNCTISESTSSAKNSALQEYLKLNRPDFIENTEKRRKAVLNCKSQREENEELKRLLYLRELKEPAVKIANPKVTRCFTGKEMRDINEKNYKRLPEVQQKLTDNKKQQLMRANRLLTEQFSKKLRSHVLKGNHTLPLDVNVVKLVCTKKNK